MADDDFSLNKDTLSRLVRLETKVCLKFEEMEKALVIARENIEKDKSLAQEQLTRKLEGMNEFQKRMDKLEGTFITRESVTVELNSIRNLITTEIKAIGVTLEAVKKTLTDTMTAMGKSFDDKHDALERNFNDKYSNLARLVYIGLGIMIALQLLWPFFAKALKAG